MKTPNNKFQSRLDAISKAEVVLHHMGDWYEIHIESSDNRLTSGPLKYTQHKSIFDDSPTSYSFVGVSEDGAIVNAYMHDGSNKIGRGYGGSPFELTMHDGSHKVLIGPWSGRPSVHTANSGIQYAEVKIGYQWHGFSKEFIEAIIDRFDLNAELELTCRNMEIELQVKRKYLK